MEKICVVNWVNWSSWMIEMAFLLSRQNWIGSPLPRDDEALDGGQVFFSNWGREIPIPFYAALLWDMKGCWVLKGNGISIILAGLLSHLQSNRVFPKRNQNWIPIGTMKLIKIKFVQSENWFLHFILSDPGQRNLSRQDPISWEIRNPLSTFFPGCYVPAHPNQQHQLLSSASRWEQMLNIYSLFLPSHSNQNTAKPLKQGHLRWI